MTTRLRWSGSVEAQRQADAAYRTLKPKPVKAKPTKKRAKNRRRHGRGVKVRTDWSGRYSEYLRSREWKAKKAVALDYHGRKCADCGATEPLEVHHLTYKRLGREKMKDLLVLCGACHRIRHEDKPDVVTTDYLSEQFRAIVGPAGTSWPRTADEGQKG